MSQIIGLLILFASFVACNRTDENSLRNPAYFGEVYAQVLYTTRVETSRNSSVAADSSAWRHARIDSILASRQLTRAQLTDAVTYYSADPQRWREVYQHVVNELDSLIAESAYPSDPISR